MKLAADLLAQGHRVCYLGIKDSEAYIAAHGFEFIPVFERHFPQGYLKRQMLFDTLPMGRRYLAGLREIALGFKRFLDDLGGEGGAEFKALLRDLQPDLMVFASAVPQIEWVATVACSLGIKAVYFHDMVTPSAALGFPPPGSDLIPSRSLWTRARIRWAWSMFKLRVCLDDLLYRLFCGIDNDKVTQALATRHGYKPELMPRDIFKRDRLLRLPEIVSFPPGFDFPGAEPPGTYYTQPYIFLERRQPPFPWERLEDGKPVIYCALGSVLPMGDKTKRVRFYRSFVEASAVRSDWHWVLAIGDSLKPEDLGAVPGNVLVVAQAPQLDLLRRSALMITHGGANSVKECIYFGVPMIVFPFLAAHPITTDQPANAARIVYHGLGVQADMGRLDAAYLGGLVDTVDRDPYIRAQIGLMRAKFHEAESSGPGLRLIEALLGGPAPMGG